MKLKLFFLLASLCLTECNASSGRCYRAIDFSNPDLLAVLSYYLSADDKSDIFFVFPSSFDFPDTITTYCISYNGIIDSYDNLSDSSFFTIESRTVFFPFSPEDTFSITIRFFSDSVLNFDESLLTSDAFVGASYSPSDHADFEFDLPIANEIDIFVDSRRDGNYSTDIADEFLKSIGSSFTLYYDGMKYEMGGSL